ncbi:MAG TPA: M3 family metallopeptidase [Myxococcota bacterium]|nr:M3 family metallopeptidase [Myxococcota bacterium]
MKAKSVIRGIGYAAVIVSVIGCAGNQVREEQVSVNKPVDEAVSGQPAPVVAERVNPLLVEWTTPFGVPPFDQILESDFVPAIKAGIQTQRAEIKAIVECSAEPDFENTVLALDASGRLLEKVELVLYNLSSAETTPGIQAILKEIAPLTTALRDDIFLDKVLFGRVDAVFRKAAALGLDPVQTRLVSEMRKSFVRAGAALDEAAQQRMRQINQELAVLGLKFGDNLLAETNAFKLVLEKPEDLAGLAQSTIDAAAAAAAAEGQQGKWLITLSYPSMWPFVQQSQRRDLRQQVIQAYASRCDRGNEYDNKEVLRRIAELRLEKAKILGYASWADFVLEERMAKDAAGVDGLLDRLWKPALAVAAREAREYAAAARRDGLKGDFMPWDWHYYAERTRVAKYGLDAAELRQYFKLDNVLSGAFELARRLYGINFKPVEGLKLYHRDVLAWEVTEADGTFVGLFLGDYHPRPGKRVGAWSSRYRSQEVVNGKDIRPIVVNVGNFTRPSGDDPALLSPDEAETLFHELGHGIHSLLAKVPYRFLGGVPRDFVELPSQIMENWVFEPEMLALYARHYKTGQPIPAELVAKIEAASRHNQGFATVEYLAASKLDMEWHRATKAEFGDAATFEAAVLKRIGMPKEIIPRYRSVYFNHIFGGGGSYSAGYYSYIWSEVLDSDAFQAFKETGDLFNPEVALKFRKNVLERGGTVEAGQMYRDFRGRDPAVEPLLKKRGLAGKGR